MNKAVLDNLQKTAMLAVAGWFLMVAPSPQALGKFDANAPIARWSVHSQMFRTRQQCEAYRTRVAIHGSRPYEADDQFLQEESMMPRVPTWASRCLDAGPPAVDIPG